MSNSTVVIPNNLKPALVKNRTLYFASLDLGIIANIDDWPALVQLNGRNMRRCKTEISDGVIFFRMYFDSLINRHVIVYNSRFTNAEEVSREIG